MNKRNFKKRKFTNHLPLILPQIIQRPFRYHGRNRKNHGHASQSNKYSDSYHSSKQERIRSLAGEKDMPCLFLEEECCFYVYHLGMVREETKRLADRSSQT
jgi:hypothetical protein